MSISSLTVWEVDSTGSDSNGGGFVAGSSGTDQSYVPNGVSTATTRTDLATGTTATQVSSATAFTSADVGNILQVTAGSGWTTGFYQIVSVTTGVATLDRAPAAASTTGGTGAVGGALLTPAKAAGAMIAGNRVWVKSATYTASTAPVMNLAFSGAKPTGAIPYSMVTGYYQNRGDITYGPLGVNAGQNGGADNRPIFQFNTGATTALSLITVGSGFVRISDLIFDCNSIVSSAGVTSNQPGTHISQCFAKKFGDSGFKFNQSSCVVERCEATLGLSPSYGFNSGSTSIHFHGCNAHDNVGIGFRPDDAANMRRCISANNTSHGVYIFTNNAVSITECTIVGNGGDGIHNANTVTGAFYIKDNIIADNTGWGLFAFPTSYPAGPMFDGNTYFGNTAGNIAHLVSGALTSLAYINAYDQIAASDPVASHATGGNFAPTTVSPGAIGTGFLSQFPGNAATTSFLDMGAIQHQDPGAVTAALFVTTLLTRLTSSSDCLTPNSIGSGLKAIYASVPTPAPGTNGGLPTVDASNNVHGLQTTSDTAGTTTLLARVPGTVQPQTGDSFARIGVNGAGLTAVGGGDTPGTTTLLTRIPGTVQPQTGDSFARLGVNGAGLSAIPGGGADTPGTTTLLARVPGTVQPQTGDSFARLGLPTGASIAADIATKSTYAGADTTGTTTLLARLPGTVQPQTGDSFSRIGVNGAGLTAVGGGDTPGTTTLLARIPGTVQPQTGDSFARIGAAGAGLTAVAGIVLDADNAAHKIVDSIGGHIRDAAATSTACTKDMATLNPKLMDPEAADNTGSYLIEFTIDPTTGDRTARTRGS